MFRLSPLIAALAALSLLSLFSLSGCANAIARHVVRAPNHAWADRLPLQTSVPATLGMSLAEAVSVRRITVASGALSLRAVVVEPTDAPWMPWTLRDEEVWCHAWPMTRVLPPIGTIVLLHGLGGSSELTSPHAACFANAGFRCILLDLRGHGESTGKAVSFGRHEAADVREALQRLAATGALKPPVAVVGCSLGGSVALMTAAAMSSASQGVGHAEDPVLAGIVAIAPFARLRDVAPFFAKRFVGWLNWVTTDALVDRVVEAIGRAADFSPEADSPLAWAHQVRQPVLLIHGVDDDLVPATQSALLAPALAGPVQRVLIPGQEHIRTVLDPGLTMPAMLAWVERLMTPDAYRALDGPLLGWVGDAQAPVRATWAWRATPADRTAMWPRPAGKRNVRTWVRIPPAWLGRDLIFDLGTIEGDDQTWCSGQRLGGGRQTVGMQLFRRYVVPGWLTTPTLEFTIQITASRPDAGIRWAAGGTALLKLSN